MNKNDLFKQIYLDNLGFERHYDKHAIDVSLADSTVVEVIDLLEDIKKGILDIADKNETSSSYVHIDDETKKDVNALYDNIDRVRARLNSLEAYLNYDAEALKNGERPSL